jgi:putative tryptophan/tyrosine transport system substrate-binding protein
MRRRDFITLLGGAAAWPIAARAQATPVIGFLRSTASTPSEFLVAAFRQGLRQAGFAEGRNVAIEYLYAESHPNRLPALARELVRRPVSLIIGDNISAIAAKAETAAIPIVFATGGDPVAAGLVASVNRPGGNVTGVSFFSGMLGPKKLDFLRQLAPRASLLGMLANPDTPTAQAEQKDLRSAAQAIGQQVVVLDAKSDGDLESAFQILVQRGAGALLVGGSSFFGSRTEQIVALAARHALPTMYFQREAVLAGGLTSYGASITDAYRQAGIYAARILKGEKPADLPVMQPVKFEFVLNLKTARTLGLDVPPTLLALADEVIE